MEKKTPLIFTLCVSVLILLLVYREMLVYACICKKKKKIDCIYKYIHHSLALGVLFLKFLFVSYEALLILQYCPLRQQEHSSLLEGVTDIHMSGTHYSEVLERSSFCRLMILGQRGADSGTIRTYGYGLCGGGRGSHTMGDNCRAKVNKAFS